MIASLEAEVIALQEVGWHWRGRPQFDQFAFLKERTGYEVCKGLVRYHGDAHFGNALLTKRPVTRAETIDLTVPLRAPRGALDADVEIGGTRVRVINVHLGLDPWERRIQLSRLLHALTSGPEHPTLLLGDFNDWRLEIPPVQALERHLPHVVAPRSFHARQPLFRFDRIYASSEFALTDRPVQRDKATRRASDHFPVRGRVTWTAG